MANTPESSIQINNKDFTLASVNVNSINNSLPQLSNFMKTHRIDALCLQETHRLDPKKDHMDNGNLVQLAKSPQTKYPTIAPLYPMAVSGIHLASININGINSALKQIPVFIKQHNIDILCIQETHFFRHTNVISYLQHHNLHIYSNSEPTVKHKQGTAIIITSDLYKNLQFQHQVVEKNRIHAISFIHNNKIFAIINTYLPSGNSADKIASRKSCIQKLMQYLQSASTHHVLLAGDFNMVLHSCDKSGALFVRQDFHAMQTLITQLSLHDSFRIHHPNTTHFTYTRKNTASRLDRIYVSESLRKQVLDVFHVPIPFSDHSSSPVMKLRLPLKTSNAENTHWKLNNALLQKPQHTEKFITQIEKWKRDSLYQVDILLWWEKFKKKTKRFFQSAGKIEKDSTQSKIDALYAQQRLLNPDTETQQLQRTHKQIQKLVQISVRGAKVRARLKNWPENEDPPPNSTQVESNKQTKKVIDFPHTSQSPSEHIHQHYAKLWGTAHNNVEHVSYLSDIHLLPDPVTNDSPLVTSHEIKTAILSLRKDTSPGTDGITAEFYQTFFKQIVPILQEVFNNIFLREHLCDTQKQALVKLLPKNPRPNHISHWRPISLLNTDYKILSKIITSRATHHLSTYISNSQQCALPDRKMEYILQNIQAVIEYSNETKTKISILQLDYSKAFDNVSHSFIITILKKINSPSHITKWIEILLRDVTSKIQVNNQTTPAIPLKKGIRQGCPLSMLLFVLATDILCQKITSSDKLPGIKLAKSSINIQQYADDTTLFLSESDSIPELKRILDQFSHQSGLQLNLIKSKFMSSSRFLSTEIKTQFPQISQVSEIKILGMLFSIANDTNKKNWERTIHKIRAIAQEHQSGHMSIYGKTILINALLLPHIQAVARLHFPTRHQIRMIERIFYKFLWYPSVLEPISRSKLTNEHKNGGIRFPDVKAKVKAAFAMSLLSTLQNKVKDQFFIANLVYNLNRKLSAYNATLWQRNSLNKPFPNSHWDKAYSLLEPILLKETEWQTLDYRSLYWIFLDPKPVNLPTINASQQPTSWLTISLRKPRPGLFSPIEKEVAFRVAHNGYLWGSFNKHLNQSTSGCVFCKRGPDFPKHIFYECHITRQCLAKLQPSISSIIGIPIVLTKAMVLYNTSSLSTQAHILLTKALAIFRAVIIEWRSKQQNRKQMAPKQLISIISSQMNIEIKQTITLSN